MNVNTLTMVALIKNSYFDIELLTGIVIGILGGIGILVVIGMLSPSLKIILICIINSNVTVYLCP